jgi:hypothetical protein
MKKTLIKIAIKIGLVILWIASTFSQSYQLFMLGRKIDGKINGDN